MNQTVSPDTLTHYRFLREMNRDALSPVWEAVDARNGCRVAIKTLALPQTSEVRGHAALAARMHREARVVARLSHPNIVTVFRAGRECGQPYLVMEYLVGRTLRERLREGPLAPAEAARILDQMTAAIDVVHAAGIVHRDIKPANFMLLEGGTVKLTDFGLARHEGDALVTQADMIVGSPSYMAPEQINGKAVKAAADVWALGVILYEMLAGRAPFGGDRISAVLGQITTADPPPVPRLPSPVRAVLRRALAKDPARRYPSAGALAAAFRQALNPDYEAPGPDAAPVSAPAAATPARQELPAALRRVLKALAGWLRGTRPGTSAGPGSYRDGGLSPLPAPHPLSGSAPNL